MSDGNGKSGNGQKVETQPVHVMGVNAAVEQAQEQYRVLARVISAGGGGVLKSSGKGLQRWLRENCGHEVIGFLLATMQGAPIFVTFSMSETGVLTMFRAPAPASVRVNAARTLLENMGLPKVEIGDDTEDGIIVLPELELRDVQEDVERRLLAGGPAQSFITEDGTKYHIEDEVATHDTTAREVQQDEPPARQVAKAKGVRGSHGKDSELARAVARVRARKRNGGG